MLKRSYSVIHKNKTLSLAGKQIELEIMLSEISQNQKNKYIFLICMICGWVRGLFMKVVLLRKRGWWNR